MKKSAWLTLRLLCCLLSLTMTDLVRAQTPESIEITRQNAVSAVDAARKANAKGDWKHRDEQIKAAVKAFDDICEPAIVSRETQKTAFASLGQFAVELNGWKNVKVEDVRIVWADIRGKDFARLAKGDERADFYGYLGEFYVLQNLTALAFEPFNEAVNSAGISPARLERWGQRLLETQIPQTAHQNWSQSRAVYEKLLALPSLGETKRAQYEFELALGRYDHEINLAEPDKTVVLATLDRVLKDAKASTPNRELAAQALYPRLDDEELEAFYKLVFSSPGFSAKYQAEIYYLRGQKLRDSGKMQEAVASLNKAIEVAHQDSATRSDAFYLATLIRYDELKVGEAARPALNQILASPQTSDAGKWTVGLKLIELDDAKKDHAAVVKTASQIESYTKDHVLITQAKSYRIRAHLALAEYDNAVGCWSSMPFSNLVTLYNGARAEWYQPDYAKKVRETVADLSQLTMLVFEACLKANQFESADKFLIEAAARQVLPQTEQDLMKVELREAQGKYAEAIAICRKLSEATNNPAGKKLMAERIAALEAKIAAVKPQNP